MTAPLLISILTSAAGLLLIILRRNLLLKLAGILLLYIAGAVNFVIFSGTASSFNSARPVMIIAVAVLIAALGLALIFKFYRNTGRLYFKPGEPEGESKEEK